MSTSRLNDRRLASAPENSDDPAIAPVPAVITLASQDGQGRTAATSMVQPIQNTPVSGPARVIDLSLLTPGQGFVIQGDTAYDTTGWSVSGAGDVNGDGLADLIIGALQGDDGGPNAGEAYVIYGQAGASRGRLDLSTLSASQGFVIQGDSQLDFAGGSVSSAGDVNGDGIDDLIVGADHDDDGGPNAGEAYVVYGQAGTSRGRLDLSTLSASQGFVIQGGSGDQAGSSVSSAGDVNGDGIDDLIVGAALGDAGGDTAGQAYVIYGQVGTSRGRVDLSALSASQGFVIQGFVANDFVGWSVSSAGDFNGDGIDDLIVGSFNPFNDQVDGDAYVIYGQAGTTRGPLDLGTLSSSDGFVIQGISSGDRAGSSVSSAGDVNGDGIDDLIVGAPHADAEGDDAGEAYVIYGQAGTTRGRLDLSTLASSEGFVIQGISSGDRAGSSVSSAGDVNGDGIDDLIVGAPYVSEGGEQAGAAYVIYGQAGTSRGRLDLSTLSASQGFVIQGASPGDFAGVSVSSAGDLNGDGFDDLIVGAPYGGDGGYNAGEAYVIYGFRTADIAITGAEAADALTGGSGAEVISGLGGDDVLDGAGGNDILQGGAGNDRMIGGAGSDTIDGGEGQDVVVYTDAAGGVSVDLSLQRATNDGGGGADILLHIEDVAGSAFDDTLIGDSGANTFLGGLGNDLLDGRGGFDRASYADRASSVVAVLDGATPIMVTVGGVAEDTLVNIENLRGGSADDQLTGDGFANILEGREGDDTLAGAAGNDTLFGQGGDDRVSGGLGDDLLDGGSGDDILNGESGDDVLDGGFGNDILNGGAGDDVLNGGGGVDTVDYSDASTGVTVNLAITTRGQKTVGSGRDILTGIENLTGSAFDDYFAGDAGDNVLMDTLGGDDRFIGGAGNDTLILERSGGGAATTSLLRGGLGDDAMSFDGHGRYTDTVAFEGQDGDDVISATGAFKANINAGAGNDRVTVDTLGGSFVVKLGSGSDTLVLAGTGGAFAGSTANLVRDFAAGNGGDVLDLTAYLAGGALTNFTAGSNPFLSGHMRLVQSGADTLVQVDRNGGGNGFVTVLTLQKTTALNFTAFNFNGLSPLPAPVEGGAGADVLNGTSAIDVLNGNGGDDVLTGGSGNDVLNGGAASDVLDGGAGDDVLNGGSGAQGDTATYASATAGVNVNLAIVGNQQDTGGSGFDSLTGIEHLVGSAFTDELRGDGFANRLTDNLGGDDFLRGEAGDDALLIARSGGGAATTVRLNGGADNDALTFAGNGRYSDTVTLEGEGGNDVITVSGAGTVGIDAGAGNDTVIYDTLGGAYRITLGEGSDTVRLAATGGQFAASGDNLVRDFATGAGGDRVDLSAWLAGGALLNYSGGNPFADGHMRLVQNGSRTLLQVDRDGGGNGYQTVLAFTNTTAASFTAANFNGFDPAGLAPMPVESADKALDAGPQTLPGLADDAFLVLPGEAKAAFEEPLVLPGAGLDGLTDRTAVFAFVDALPFHLMAMHDRDSLPGGPRDDACQAWVFLH